MAGDAKLVSRWGVIKGWMGIKGGVWGEGERYKERNEERRGGKEERGVERKEERGKGKRKRKKREGGGRRKRRKRKRT